MPQEFTTVTSSSYDAAGLATKLTEKSAEGWDVVSVVSTGTEIAAILEPRRHRRGHRSDVVGRHRPAVRFDAGYAAATAAASEPAGWGTSPAATSSPAGGYSAASAPSGAYAATSADPSSGYSAASQPSSATAAPAAAASTASSVPAGWYADPAGRFDLRYWDGGTWTEHVSRAGQQFTDPPVA